MAFVKVVKAKQDGTWSEPPVITKKPYKRKMNEEQVVQQPLTMRVGAYVCVNKVSQRYGEGERVKTVREQQIPCQLTRIHNEELVCISVPDTCITPVEQYTTEACCLRLITKQEYDSSLKLIRDNNKRELDRIRSEKQSILNPVYEPIPDRRGYVTSSKDFLVTNSNYLSLGTVASKDGGIKGAYLTNHCGAVCCSLTKVVRDVVVYIPIPWTTYFGYTEEDLNKWLQFISLCEIGFKAYLDKDRPSIKSVFGRGNIGNTSPLVPNNNFYIDEDMPCYRVVIKSGEAYMHTYMYFILIRYMYNNIYWNIPFISMQIKIGVGDALSFWDCLLLAHCNALYGGYYALTANTDTNIALPTKENSAARIMSRLASQNSVMNTSFIYSVRNRTDVSDLIHAQDYEGLIALVEKLNKTK